MSAARAGDTPGDDGRVCRRRRRESGSWGEAMDPRAIWAKRAKRENIINFPLLERLPKDSLDVVLSCSEGGDLARLGGTCSWARTASESYASRLLRQRGWRMADSVMTSVERLATEVCVFETGSFRAVGSGAPRLHHATANDVSQQAAPYAVVMLEQPSATLLSSRAASSSSSLSEGEVAVRTTRSSHRRRNNRVVAARFSERASRLTVMEPGRYRVSGLAEPCLRTPEPDDRAVKRRRLNPDAAHIFQVMPPSGAASEERLAFQVRIVESGSPLSSIYVGVATKRWAARQGASQAIRSDEAWLLDLRRARFVHGFPSYDRAMVIAHGERSRQFATTDDVVRSGDVLGVRVVGTTAHFFRNGRRLAHCAGGLQQPALAAPPAPQGAGQDDNVGEQPNRPHRPREAAGWGRPIPLGLSLVPIVEVHARAPASTSLELELAAWRPPAWCVTPTEALRRVEALATPTRRTNNSNTLQELPDDSSSSNSTTFSQLLVATQRRTFSYPQPRRAGVVPVDDRRIRRDSADLVEYSSWACLRMACAVVVPLLPLLVGTQQIVYDLLAFAFTLAVGNRTGSSRTGLLAQVVQNFAVQRPWSLGFAHAAHASLEAFALSLACSAVWKCHFYDRRRPRRSRRGLRALLRAHLGKCVAVALAVGTAPVGFSLSSDCGIQGPYLGWSAKVLPEASMGVHASALLGGFGSSACVRVDWWLRNGLSGSLATCFMWLAAEAFSELGFQVCRVLLSSRLAAALCNFPLGASAADRLNSLRAVLKLFTMMCCIPGSAAPLLSLAASHLSKGIPTSPVAIVLYPFLTGYLVFVVFVKFAFIVFGLNTLCGFEDFDPPGWLLD